MGNVCTGIHVVEGLPLWTSLSAPGDTGRSMLSQRGVVWTILSNMRLGCVTCVTCVCDIAGTRCLHHLLLKVPGRYSFISKSCTCNEPTTTISYLTYSTRNLNPSTIIADRSSLLGLHQQYCVHTTQPGDSPIGIIRWTFVVLECDHTDTRIGNIWPETVID